MKNRQIRRWHRVAARGFENETVFLDLTCRLRPPAVRVAIATERGAIKPGDYPECKKLLADSSPLFLCDLVQVTGARRDCRLGVGFARVQLSLARVSPEQFQISRRWRRSWRLHPQHLPPSL